MPDDVKRIPIAEFREQGFLQEANRQFFHPLGLALEVAAVGEGPDEGIKKTVYDALKDDCRLGLLIQREAGGGLPNDEVLRRIEMIAERVALRLAPPGSMRLGGVWDYREDPAGVYFGDERDVGKALAVADLRSQHFNRRAALFASGARTGRADGILPAEPMDVQPLDWQPSKEQHDDDGDVAAGGEAPAG